MNRLGLFFTLLLAIISGNSIAQLPDTAKRYQVAVFIPLFLDSAFDDLSSYRYGKNFPKFINPGLEFYEGCLMAIDSLDKEGVPLDVNFYDSRTQSSSVQNVIGNPLFDSTDLIIGHVNANEAKMLANHAAKKNVPFINATYPNDAGVANNPNYIILNSTLYTHCHAIYKYIQKYHSLKQVVLFRKKGLQEDRLQEYFDNISKNTNSVPLKIKIVTLEDDFTGEDISQHLGEGASVCIAGSLDLAFGQHVAQHLAAVHSTMPSVLFGMPNWWDVTDFSKPEYKNIEIIYTTPFYLSPTDPLVTRVQTEFKSKYYSRPTDMVYRGYETLYHFAHLLQTNGQNFGSALSDKKFKLFNDFEIQPVLDPKTTTLDYFENKKIYFIKKVDGVVTAVY